MKRLVVLALAAIVCNSALAETANTVRRISNAEAMRVVRKAFAPACGGDTQFRCPYALENRPDCPFEALVLLPLWENGTYDGRSRAVWMSLSKSGEILRVSRDKASVCPIV
jgi:hypothetical protein